jgi:tetratricopeptide (TPR) repeat protein
LDPGLRGDLWNLSAYVAYLDREMGPARDFYQKAYEAYLSINDQRGVQKAISNLGTIDYAEGEVECARERFAEACEASLKLGSLVSYAENLLRLGRANFDLLNFEESLRNLNLAKSVVTEAMDASLFQRIRLVLGVAWIYLGDATSAERALEGARKFFQTSADPHGRVQSVRLLALLRAEQGRFEEALALVESVEGEAESFENERQFLALLKAETLAHLGRRDGALEVLRDFERKIPPEKQSPVIQMQFQRVSSVSEERRDPGRLAKLKECAREGRAKNLERDRLALLVEALEYGPDGPILAEAKSLFSDLSARIPEALRPGFVRRSAFSKLRMG